MSEDETEIQARRKAAGGETRSGDIRRRDASTHFSAEEKIRVVLEGLRGEESVAELCRREGIASSMYYGWSKEFAEEAGKEAACRRHGTRRDFRLSVVVR